VLVSVLEGLDHAENLIDVATNGKIVHAHLAEDTLAIDDVSGTECDTFVLRVIQKAAVIASDTFRDVRNHRDLHGAEATLRTRLHRVLSVSELRVD